MRPDWSRRFRRIAEPWSAMACPLPISVCVRVGAVHERTSARRQVAERGLGKILHQDFDQQYPRVAAHFTRLLGHEHFKVELEPYVRKHMAAAALEKGMPDRSFRAEVDYG
jgi:hypothetical protein